MNLFGRSKKADNELGRRVEAIIDLDLRHVNIFLVDAKGEEEDLGRTQLLRSDGRIYREGESLFLTTPDKLKSQATNPDKPKAQTIENGNPSSQTTENGNPSPAEDAPPPPPKAVLYDNQRAVLRFIKSGMPYEVPCTIVQRVRLKHEQIELLDFAGIKSAFRIVPTSMPRNQNKRQFLQFNYVADDKKAVVHQITMELFVQKTNLVLAPDALLEDRVSDIVLTPYSSAEDAPFEIDLTLREFYTAMRALPPRERLVNLTKIVRTTERGMSADEQLNHGRVSVLSVDNEELLNRVRGIYLKKSVKSDRDRTNKFNLLGNDTIILSYLLDGTMKSFVCKVVAGQRQRLGNDLVRPTSIITHDPGFRLHVMNFRGNGIMVTSDMEFLRYLTGENLEEFDFHRLSSYQENILQDIKTYVLYCAIYPEVKRDTYEVHFRKSEAQLIDRFIPELPYKIKMLGRIVRTERIKGQLCHSLQFDYDTQMFQLAKDDIMLWRMVPKGRGNKHFRDMLFKLSGFEAYLRKKQEEGQGE
ncbi:MAG: hypothetical protein HYW07_10240 [Candidatus Latescibacteria bacterium]|nr:hypothetical protein [Candidatus Latescibacterota bacterium]